MGGALEAAQHRGWGLVIVSDLYSYPQQDRLSPVPPPISITSPLAPRAGAHGRRNPAFSAPAIRRSYVMAKNLVPSRLRRQA
jgi:hypothetical protein